MIKLNEPSLLNTHSYINGEWVNSDNKFEVTNPANAEVLTKVSLANGDDAEAAVAAAKAAMPAWAAKSAAERPNIVIMGNMPGTDLVNAIYHFGVKSEAGDGHEDSVIGPCKVQSAGFLRV